MQNPTTGNVGDPLLHSGGMALVEVLLSSLLVTTGMLAVLSMQTQALATAQSNRQFMQAEWLLNDMLERMKANPGGYARALTSTAQGEVNVACETPAGCSSMALAAHDLALWYGRLESSLPAGHGEITPTSMPGFPDAASVYRVLVQWHDYAGDSHGAAMPHSSSIVVL